MLNFYRVVVQFFIYILIILPAVAQVHTPHYNTKIGTNINGFYEYLPKSYNSGTSVLPLIIACHGQGQLGNGSEAELPKVIEMGLPQLIEQGRFPESFIVNGNNFQFVVISPQFVNWPDANNINEIINYAVEHYKINANRIYLTGHSMGGGVTCVYAGQNTNFAKRLAAIIPIAPAFTPSSSNSQVIAEANLPVWATHNDGDTVVPVSNTISFIESINEAKPQVPAKMTIFHSDAHDAWTQTYDPAFKESNLNIYEWMLQYDRSGTALPVKLIQYSASISRLFEVELSWTTAEEINNDYFIIERSTNGNNFRPIGKIPAKGEAGSYHFTDVNPKAGDNFYRLVEVDNNGRTTYFEILKISLGTIPTSLSLIPNPVQNKLAIRLKNETRGLVSVQLINSNGSLVQGLTFHKTDDLLNEIISLEKLSYGIYILKISGSNFVKTEKLIKH